jgi:hypothetical protein
MPTWSMRWIVMRLTTAGRGPPPTGFVERHARGVPETASLLSERRSKRAARSYLITDVGSPGVSSSAWLSQSLSNDDLDYDGQWIEHPRAAEARVLKTKSLQTGTFAPVAQWIEQRFSSSFRAGVFTARHGTGDRAEAAQALAVTPSTEEGPLLVSSVRPHFAAPGAVL